MPEKIPCQLSRLRQPLKHWLGQKALSDSLGGINANINKQINATELQNALLEKANTEKVILLMCNFLYITSYSCHLLSITSYRVWQFFKGFG